MTKAKATHITPSPDPLPRLVETHARYKNGIRRVLQYARNAVEPDGSVRIQYSMQTTQQADYETRIRNLNELSDVLEALNEIWR